MSKKLVQINTVCNGSTGKIMQAIQKQAEKEGYEVYNFFGRGEAANDRCFKICSKLDIYFHVLISRLLDRQGYGCKHATKKLVKKLKEINPDVIQLHNIHGYYINMKVLFDYLKICNSKIVWTLHDCWAFTGHCSYFTMNNCDKWKNGCIKCKYKKTYPTSLFSYSEKNYILKKKLFTDIKNLTIVTPSDWLSKLVKKSFLTKYNVKTINNGINVHIFRFKCDINLYKKYNIPSNKKVILGIASVWDKRKGLDDFIKLSKILNNNYVIVLVGLKKKQIKHIKKSNICNIVCIRRIESQEELSSLYSCAQCFVNTTYEDNFPTVNLEALACGTPVITYNTGGSIECINQNVGKIIEIGDINNLKNGIYSIYKNKNTIDNCIKTSKQYNEDNTYLNYLKLYKC